MINYDIISNHKYKEMFNYTPFEDRNFNADKNLNILDVYQNEVLNKF